MRGGGEWGREKDRMYEKSANIYILFKIFRPPIPSAPSHVCMYMHTYNSMQCPTQWMKQALLTVL